MVGTIKLKKAAAGAVSTSIAYAVISHGEDGLGAVKLNYSAANAADGPPDSAHRWCSGSTDIAYTNCLATAATVMDAPFNNGKDAGAAYFDDIVIAGDRPKILTSTVGYYAFGWGGNSATEIGNSNSLILYSPRKVYTGGLTFTSASPGGGFVCGLTAAGAAYCWGAGYYGQLGDGLTLSTLTPTAVSGGITFASIKSGYETACGLSVAGAAYCWGRSLYGGIGDGTMTTRSSPVAVSGGHTFISVEPAASQSGFTCALKSTGAAYCWGYNGQYQLGDGTNTTRTSPVAVGGGIVFSSISVGGAHVCGLTAAGVAYCWGDNQYGQLGDTTTTTRTAPTAVAGGYTFASINAGDSHTCGLTTGNVAYCWGRNQYGQVGDATTTTPRTSPTAVAGGITFASITASSSFSCGLTSAGVAYCWGFNQFGQVGDSSGASKSSPSAVTGGRLYTSISDGYCALSGGDVYCWGNNTNGHVGILKAHYEFKPTPVYGGYKFISIASGDSHGCGVRDNNDAYCWGYNATGRLGEGSSAGIYRTTPYAVLGGLKFGSVTLGFAHSCGLTTAGAAYCWGDGGSGQRGDGTTSQANSPVAVTGGLTFSSLSTGRGHTCGLTSAGVAYCWGLNTTGQIGDGTTTSPRSSPTAVTGGLTFSSIKAGQYHTCGIATGGVAYCWGRNDYGQVGDGTVTTPRSSPTAVTGGLTFSTITAGDYHSCGITTGGASYCWGANLNGQVGDNTVTSPRSSPTAVSGGLTFTKIEASALYTCAMTSAGAMYCWGASGPGSLGDNTSSANPHSSPVQVLNSGTANFTIADLGDLGTTTTTGDTTFALVTSAATCTDLWSSNTVPEGMTYMAFASAAPTGSCAAEYRTCTSGSFTGSYAQQSCTSGCDSRTVDWTGGPGCSGTMPALAGGGSTVVNSSGPGAGSVTANCSATGVVTLTGGSCS